MKIVLFKTSDQKIKPGVMTDDGVIDISGLYPNTNLTTQDIIVNVIDSYETNNNTSLSNLKLYRKKPLPSEKKSITSSMNLIIENND